MSGWRAFGAWALVSLGLAGCGGGSSGTPAAPVTPPVAAAANVVDVHVDAGPDPVNHPTINTLYTTVTVCVPGNAAQCQRIDHIQVDTQSYGLRLLAPVLTLSLPVSKATDGNSLVECTQFADGYSWGPVATADIQIAGEMAAAVPIQLIGSANFSTVPAACSSAGPAENTVAAFGANGILGIGAFVQDCPGCDINSGAYYSCTPTACSPIVATLNSQVANPVAFFAGDNNGVIITLPAVAAAGAATVSGSLIFGVDTQADNASGAQTVLTLNSGADFTTAFNGQTLTRSFIDSGSNGIYFNDSAIPACPNQAVFYCPPGNLMFTATLTGQNGTSTTQSFVVANARSLQNANPSFTALPGVAGTFVASSTSFDWGLPFFFGRRVATVISGDATSAGQGPYVAF
ncbi:MAG: DUF3443 domain-containing protein [Steroidobacteraceae bacterium]